MDRLRALLKALNESSVHNTTVGTSDENPDEEFLKRLNSVREQLRILLSKAEDTSVSDKELMKRLDAVNQTLFLIESKLKDAEGKTLEADKNSKTASGEIDLAEDSIERSWKLVEQIRGPTNQTQKVINLIYEIFANWTKTTLRIQETVREVKLILMVVL